MLSWLAPSLSPSCGPVVNRMRRINRPQSRTDPDQKNIAKPILPRKKYKTTMPDKPKFETKFLGSCVMSDPTFQGRCLCEQERWNNETARSKEESIVLDNTIQDQQQQSSLSKSNSGPNSSTIGSRLHSFLRLLKTIQVVTQQGPLSWASWLLGRNKVTVQQLIFVRFFLIFLFCSVFFLQFDFFDWDPVGRDGRNKVTRGRLILEGSRM